MAPAGAPGGRPLVAGAHAGIESRAQRIAPRRGDCAAQQEITVTVESRSLLRLQGIDLRGCRITVHGAPYNLNVPFARAGSIGFSRRTTLIVQELCGHERA
ncbi:hypothetical protein [Bradyrhizobium diazoefficiens]|uniref:hypothetical protein n=1 Tax=Bradyrhizobium diazoefficiens TaxID=1355477 RepID=UPI003836B50F